MSGRTTRVDPLTAVLTALLCGVLVAALSACGSRVASDGSVVPPALSLSPSAPASATTAPAASRTLSVVSWGRDGDLLSLLVRNDGSTTLAYARTRITVLDRQGRVLLRTSGAAASTCCTVVGLSPGKRFGLFVNLPSTTAAVGGVRVDVVSHGRISSAHPAPHLRVGHATLTRTSGDAIVTARLTAPASIAPYVAGQAVLTDRKGRLVAVISGRFYCFGPHSSRVLHMQLLHPVPRGTRIAEVLGYAVPRHSPVASPPVCHGA